MSDFEVRDLRSASHASNRVKNISAKYNHGTRVLSGDLSPASLEGAGHIDTIDTPREHFKKTRPAVLPRPVKSRHNNTPPIVQLSPGLGPGHVRPVTKKDRSIMEYREEGDGSRPSIDLTDDSAILYSFEDQGKSPNANGREVGLDELVDRAEEEWENGQTDRMVKEYEVLDRKGGKVHLSAKKEKVRGSQSQGEREVAKDEDEGFEVV